LKRYLSFIVLVLVLCFSVSVVSAQDDSTLAAWADTPASAFNVTTQMSLPSYWVGFKMNGYTAVGDVTPSCVTSHSHSLWHTFVAPRNAKIYILSQGSNYDALIAVYRTSPTLANEVACFNTETGAGSYDGGSVTVHAGVRYYVMLAAALPGPTPDANSSLFQLYRTNDAEERAYPIPGSGVYRITQYRVETGDATEPQPNSDCAGYDHVVFYKFKPTVSGSYQFLTTGSSYDTLITITDGTSFSACNDNINTNNYNSRLTVTLTAGTTYQIVIGQSSDAEIQLYDNMMLSLRVRKL
jgi:hypothetical protein